MTDDSVETQQSRRSGILLHPLRFLADMASEILDLQPLHGWICCMARE